MRAGLGTDTQCDGFRGTCPCSERGRAGAHGSGKDKLPRHRPYANVAAASSPAQLTQENAHYLSFSIETSNVISRNTIVKGFPSLFSERTADSVEPRGTVPPALGASGLARCLLGPRQLAVQLRKENEASRSSLKSGHLF